MMTPEDMRNWVSRLEQDYDELREKVEYLENKVSELSEALEKS